MNNTIPTIFETIGSIRPSYSDQKLKDIIQDLQNHLNSIPKEFQNSAIICQEYYGEGEIELVIRYERPMTQGEIDAQKLAIERREKQEYNRYLELKQKFEPNEPRN